MNEQKKHYFCIDIQSILQTAYPEIDSAVYSVRDDGDEFVRVTLESGKHKDINVSADSLSAMLRDVVEGVYQWIG